MSFPEGDDILRVIRNTAWEALQDFSEGLLTKMVNRAPIRTGHLRRMHTVVPRPKSAVVFVANTPYAEPLHEGSKPYVIRPKVKKALHWPGLPHPVKKVNHPGLKPRPWMREVVEENLDNGADYIKAEIYRALNRRF